MNYLNIDQLLGLHTLIITKYGGSFGIRDVGRLEAALATQRQVVFGQELYPDIYSKAAAIMRGIVADHPFFDGNKRTGTLAALTLIEMNDKTFIANTSEIENFAVSVATDHLDVEAIAVWLEEHTK